MGKEKNKIKTKDIAVIGILGGLTVVLGLTPLGFIPIGPTKATTMHIPVIIGGIIKGPGVGMAIGLIFGMMSVLQAFLNPTPVSFVFMNPIIAIIPRVLMGLVSYYVYDFFKGRKEMTIRILVNGLIGIMALYLGKSIYTNIRLGEGILAVIINVMFLVIVIGLGYYANKYKKGRIEIILASASASMVNTFGVLFLIYSLYGERFVSAMGGDIGNVKNIILGIGLVNGLPESILAIIITTAIGRILLRGE